MDASDESEHVLHIRVMTARNTLLALLACRLLSARDSSLDAYISHWLSPQYAMNLHAYMDETWSRHSTAQT